MPNEEYQVLIRRPGAEARERLIGWRTRRRAATPLRRTVRRRPGRRPAATCSPTWAATTQAELERRSVRPTRDRGRPSVIFAYTIKGWRLPFAGDASTTPRMLNADQIEALAPTLGADADDPWAALRRRLAGGAPARAAPRRAWLRRRLRSRSPRPAAPTIPAPDVRIGTATSTQQAFGDSLAALARDPHDRAAHRDRLAGRVGVHQPRRLDQPGRGLRRRSRPRPRRRQRPLTWQPGPTGQHIELGISEMNLFMWLSQFGLDRRAVRRAAGPDRHGLRPVHRARPRRAHLRALRRVAASSSSARRRA